MPMGSTLYWGTNNHIYSLQWCFLSHDIVIFVDSQETQAREHNWNDRCFWDPSGVLCCHRVCSGTNEPYLLEWAISSIVGLMGFGWLTLSDNARLRVNCLRYLRMIDAFQKNKFRRLLSSWYAFHSCSVFFSHIPVQSRLGRLHGFSTSHFR